MTVGGNEPIALSNPNICNPTFAAPPLGPVSSDVLTFRLTVSDSLLQGQATVNFTAVNADRAPECHATAPAAVTEGTPSVALDGSSSFDPDGDAITSHWVQTGGPSSLTLTSPDAPVSYFNAPLLASGTATYTFALTVSDGELSTTCGVSVAIDKLDHCPVPNAGAPRTVKEGRTVVLDGTASSDADGDTLLYSWAQTSGPAVTLANAQGPTPSFQAPLVGPSGADLVFQLSVDDQAGCAQSASVIIHVTDVGDAPTCGAATASPGKLWPPNHKLAPLHVTGVDDNDLTTTITVDSVFQDEPPGDGDGDRDAVILGSSALVRAERAGNGDGRVYHVRFTATNAQGSCTGEVTVCVPHADGSHATCVDEGALYDSVAP